MRKIVGKFRHYAWGTTDVIPKLIGQEPDGRPHAEYWLGSYPASPADVADEDQQLDEYLRSNPQLLGEKHAEYDDTLPYLVKILSAAEPLSLQAHPNTAQAESGFAHENESGLSLDDPKRTFKDKNAKPEALIALTEFDALVGFRDPQKTVELFDQLKTNSSLEPIIGPLRHRHGEAALAEVFLDSLSSSELHQELTNEVVSACVPHVNEDSPLGDLARTAVLLDEHFPGDPSIFAALLLNHYHLHPGEGVYVPPGTMHSYLQGSGVEVMASSDNVLRGGLTNKHIDIDALIQVVDFTPADKYRICATEVSPGVWLYPIPEDTFQIWRVNPEGEPKHLPGDNSPRIVLALYGGLELQNDEHLTLSQGESAFISAAEQVNVNGTGTAYIAAVPQN